MTDAPTKVPLVTAALIAAVIVAQQLVLSVYSVVVQITVFPQPEVPLSLGAGYTMLQVVLDAVFFSVGVFVSLRFVAPIHGDDAWRKVIVRGLIATAVGALSSLAFVFIASLIAAIGPNSQFFGYAFNLQFKEGQPSIISVLGGALNPLVLYLPLVVLAAVLQRLWLSRPPKYT